MALRNFGLVRSLGAVVGLALVGSLSSGCTIVTRSGRAESPEHHEHARNEANESRPPRPAKPRPVPRKPDPRSVEDSKDPDPRPAKPAKPDVEPVKDPPAKPLPNPEPKPTKPTKPEPTKPEPTKPPKPEPAKPEPPKPEPPKPPELKGIEGFVVGKPPGLKSGHPDAYWIWLDEEGWHMRTTTDNPAIRHFTGRIFLPEGSFTEMKKSRLEDKDRIVQTDPKTIEFDLETFGQIDGVDMKFTGTKCIQFKLLIDGKFKPELIFIGAKKIHPTTPEFAICR